VNQRSDNKRKTEADKATEKATTQHTARKDHRESSTESTMMRGRGEARRA
jgi:hypothetical protein